MRSFSTNRSGGHSIYVTTGRDVVQFDKEMTEIGRILDRPELCRVVPCDDMESIIYSQNRRPFSISKYQVQGNKKLKDFNGGHTACVFGLAVCGDILVSGDWRDQNVIVWNHTSGDKLHQLPYQGVPEISRIFLQRGQDGGSDPKMMFILGTNPNAIKQYSMSSPGEVRAVGSLKGHEGTVEGMTTHNSMLVSASLDKTLRFWDPATYHEISNMRISTQDSYGHCCLASSDASHLVVTGTYGGLIRAYDTRRCGGAEATTPEVARIENGKAHSSNVQDMCFCDWGRSKTLFVSVAYRKTAALWDLGKSAGNRVVHKKENLEGYCHGCCCIVDPYQSQQQQIPSPPVVDSPPPPFAPSAPSFPSVPSEVTAATSTTATTTEVAAFLHSIRLSSYIPAFEEAEAVYFDDLCDLLDDPDPDSLLMSLIPKKIPRRRFERVLRQKMREREGGERGGGGGGRVLSTMPSAPEIPEEDGGGGNFSFSSGGRRHQQVMMGSSKAPTAPAMDDDDDGEESPFY